MGAEALASSILGRDVKAFMTADGEIRFVEDRNVGVRHD